MSQPSTAEVVIPTQPVRKGHLGRIVNRVLVVLGCLWLLEWGWGLAGGLTLFPWHWKEVSRITSPDMKKVAILMQGNRGAMSGYRYAWHILPFGKAAPSQTGWPQDAVMTCRGIAPIGRWTSDSRLSLTAGRTVLMYQFAPYIGEFGVSVDVVCDPGK